VIKSETKSIESCKKYNVSKKILEMLKVQEKITLPASEYAIIANDDSLSYPTTYALFS